MSKKRKARIITIAAISVFCVALLAIVLVTQLRKLGTEANTLAVENWLNEEETVVLGTCYEVSEMSAIGTDGTEYPVDVNVYRV